MDSMISQLEKKMQLSTLSDPYLLQYYQEDTMQQHQGMSSYAGGGGGEGKSATRSRKKAGGKCRHAGTEGDYSGVAVDAEAAKKRRLTDEQVRFLETNFGQERKLESGRKEHLAAEIGLDPKQVAVWFQNRRARYKNKQMEEEFHKLKAMHDAVVLEKCHLENEVSKLKEKLSQAEEETRRFEGSVSPSSSFAADYPFLQSPMFGEEEMVMGGHNYHQQLINHDTSDYYYSSYTGSAFMADDELIWED